MSRTAQIVGSVVGQIAWHQLRPMGRGPRPALRATNFSPDEVVAIVAEIERLRREEGDYGLQVKVGTDSPVEGILKSYLLGSGETLTYWRNAHVPAILLVDWAVQGDEEGLAAVNRLDDVSILGELSEEVLDQRLQLVADIAWFQSGGSGRPPGTLVTALETVRTSLVAMSLRRWTSFVAASCEVALTAPLLTPDALQRAVGASLDHLELFPDPELFGSESPARTRLTRNVNVTDLRKPGGAAVTEDDVLALIDACEFDSATAERLDLAEPQLREVMKGYVQGRGRASRSRLDLSVWLELFENRSAPAGLGQQIREELERTSQDRVDEFNALDLEAALDHSEQEAAEALLRAEPPAGSRPIMDVISSRLRRRVEKLAFPDARLEMDPLRALLHVIHVLDEGLDGPVVLSLDQAPEEGPWSRWLFALIYGATLSEVCEATAEERLALTVDDRLTGLERPDMPAADDVFESGKEWAPLRLTVTMPDAAKRSFKWDPLSSPGVIALGALVESGSPVPGWPVEEDLESFFGRLQDPRSWANLRANDVILGDIPARMRGLHEAQASVWCREGLASQSLEQYLGEWELLLAEARVSLVPSAAPNADLEAVVLLNVLQLPEGRLLMVATHPLRLRWVARHLRRMSQYLKHALSVGLKLNAENSDLFFEWLDRVSPHGTPPLAVGPNETVAIAARESAWHEEYVPISQNGNERRDWLAAVDDAAIEELVKVVGSYLDTYPYKMDGLSVLLLDRDGSARLPLRFATRLRSQRPGVRLQLHVLAEASRHHDIVRAFDTEFADLDLTEERLLPDVQLVLRAWEPDTDPELDSLRDRIDVALAPAVFGTTSTLSSQTRTASAGVSGAYDPWIHSSSYDVQDSGQNVVRAMLPSQRDPILEAWSTLCLRADRHSAVAPQQESNTDYFQLTVRFDKHQRLFVQLHGVAHWVVTLDAFIGRDQIDALEDKPDVLLVRPGVGKNEIYTLIVSSDTGKRFVVQRMTKKLRNDLRISEDLHPAEHVASRIYDVGRHVVPGAVLRALGLGRAANEVLGLVASRFAVAEREPIPTSAAGLVVWLSFDEQQDWFGRTTRTRADLGRFVLTLDEETGNVRLNVLVVESKFRRHFDLGVAEQQLDRTTELVWGAFSGGEDRADDFDFWMQELASAIEQTSAVLAPASDLPARRVIGPPRESLEQAILQSIRAGAVSMESVKGIAVAIGSEDPDPAPETAQLGAHQLVRINKPELTSIIHDLVEGRDPTSSAQAVESPTEAVPGAAASVIDHSEPFVGVTVNEESDSNPREGVRAALPASEGATERAEAADRGLSDEELKRRYERLLDVLQEFGVNVTPPPSDPWREGPGFYVLRVIPRTGVSVDRVVNRVNEIALALHLPAGSQIRTSLDRGSIVFEVPKSPEERYPVDATDLWEQCPVPTDKLIVPIGADISGVPIQIEFSSPDSPHLLVAGTTGSGKSVALETILRGLCRYPTESVRLRLVDPKGTELIDFEDDPHTDGPNGFDASDAIAILEQAVQEMESRYALMRPVRARSLPEYNASVGVEQRRPWIVVVLDEYADLTSDPDDKSQIEALLRRLTQKARAAGIHVIAATQRPSADVVSTTIRSNLPAQLALRVKTATDSRIILDEAGAETLAGQGDAFLRTARGLQRLQVAWSG